MSIQEISTILIAATALITAAATVVLAIITRRYVTLTQQMLENSYRPEVIVSLLYEGVRAVPVTSMEYKSVTDIKIGVKNVGIGVARKIEFEVDISFCPCEYGSRLSDIYFLVKGVDRLAPGEEKRSNKDFVVNQSGDLNQLQTTIKSTWEDSKGMKYSGDFNLNFADPDLPPQMVLNNE